MSISTHQNELIRFQKVLADLQKKLSDESKKEASKAGEISRIERSITVTSPVSMLRSKQQQINRAMFTIADIQKKKAELSKKIADINGRLHRAQEALSKEQEIERRKIYEAEKKREREQLSHQKAITQELRSQYSIKSQFSPIQPRNVKYDVFISHASEDKEDFVKPLVEALQAAGYKVWYDEFTLKVGDSLRRSIDNGLKNSRYGIVVLSSSFFAKNWTQYELDGLVTKEMDGHKVILPIWHMVSKNQVQNYSPTLADKKALNSSLSTISEIVSQLAEVLDQK
ncbi:MAG: TIR domain-containing protein [Sedimentisphaerales bacterium]|nr:TIR domain-containing protein [Sedimentisphaerales bacterium]